MNKLYLGVDLGTSSLKCSLSDVKGNIIDSSSESYSLLIPKINWTEQNADDWYNALVKVLKDLGTRNNLKDIQAVSFCGQMHGLVILDEEDKVIRPAILWNDSRTVKEVDYLNEEIGIPTLIEETSNIALCGFTAPKILWVYNNEPENFKKIRKIMLPKDYLAYKMSGTFASDVSDLSGTLLFDVKNRKYSQKMLSILHINEEMLPKICNSYDVIGTVTEDFSNETGLNKDALVVIGGGDQAVGAIGTNTIKDKTMFISLGTSGVVFTASDNYSYDKEGRIHSFMHATGKYHLMGCTLCAAGSLKWWFEDILKVNDYSEELENIPDEISDILFLPYLTGERSPINDPNAKGYFSNLNLYYKREHLTKALIEGVSLSLYDTFVAMKNAGVEVKEARVIGGGTKSNKWMQILADVFNLEMKTISISDGGTLGAIILALVGVKEYSSLEEAANIIVKDKKVYTPNLENHKKYLEKYKNFKELYLKTK